VRPRCRHLGSDLTGHLKFLDQAKSERFVLALEGPKGDWIIPYTVFYAYVFGLLSGFPDRVNTLDEVAKKSCRVASMASEESVGRRAEASEFNWGEFQFPKQML